MIGRIISHYQILEKLGGGGMGVVYKARDLKLDRFVAIKFLPPQYSQDDESEQRFINEAKSASALDHTNIATIHEIDETDNGQLFIVMAYYEGETLKNKIKRGRMEITDAIDITIQIAEGLKKAHQRNIVHRDIKPANIIITKDNVVKIVDFGLAKFLNQAKITKSGTTLGTVAYMSPEQALGKETDTRSDIWSLGVVLYEMLTGQLPFKGEGDQAIIYSIININPESIQEHFPQTPPELTSIVNQLLEKDRSKRYQNFADLIRDIVKVQNSYQKNSADQTRFKIGFYKTPRNFKIKKWIFISVIILSVYITYKGILLFSSYKTNGHNKDITKTHNRITIVGEALKVAILPFANINAPENIEKFIYDNLQVQFMDTTVLRIITFELIDKFTIGDKVNKMSLNRSEIISTKKVVEIGNVLNVDALIIGSITTAVSNTVNIDIRVVETETGSILTAKSTFWNTSEINGIGKKLKQLIIEIIKDIPHVEGYIIGTNDFKVLNKGKLQGLKNGRQCIIFRTGEPIKHPDTKEILGWKTQEIAEVIIINSFDTISHFKVLKKYSESNIAIGDKFVTK